MKNNKIEQSFLNFFSKQPFINPPFLLGFSGGCDSTALFYLLLRYEIPFFAVYINHGWRKESSREGELLAALCESKKVPFCIRHLAIDEKRNIEDAWRKKRLTIFKELCLHHQLTGVMLGHHADDQAETVLKRLLEGSTIPKLQGLISYRVVDGLPLCRPLLTVRKKDLIHWLDSQSISYFVDESNADPRFLRGRMRKQILPLLSQQFGKDVVLNLCRLGETAQELKVLTDELLQSYKHQINFTETSTVLDVSSNPPQFPYLWKLLIRQFFETQNMTISNHLVENVFIHVTGSRGTKKMQIGKRQVWLRKGMIEIFFNTMS